MGQISCPETSVRNYHYSLRNNTEEHSFQLLRCGNFKSGISILDKCHSKKKNKTGRSDPVSRPIRSPDLTPLDFSLGDFVNCVSRYLLLQTTQELKIWIS